MINFWKTGTADVNRKGKIWTKTLKYKKIFHQPDLGGYLYALLLP